MFISNAIYKSVPAVLPVPIVEGTIVTINGLQVGEGDVAYGIVPQTVSAIPATGRIQVAVAGMIDLTSDANKAVSFTEDDMKALGADFNFVPGEEHSGGGGGGNATGIIARTISGAYTNSEATLIGEYAFYNCVDLESVDMPAVESLSSSAFTGCSNLAAVSFPEALRIGGGCFSACGSLSQVYMPKLTNMPPNAFYQCGLVTAEFPAMSAAVGSSAFRGCASLTTISLPKAQNIYNYAFTFCTSLSEITLPMCANISQYAFSGCTSLKMVSLPNLAFGISASAFAGCTALESLYLLNSTTASLSGTNAFANTPLSASSYLGRWGSIFVRSSLLDSWKALGNWSAYKDRMVGLTDEQIEALG